jgi:hypothetical protein
MGAARKIEQLYFVAISTPVAQKAAKKDSKRYEKSPCFFKGGMVDSWW